MASIYTAALMAVSYTHLDVYKRQVLYLVGCLGRLAAVGLVLHVERERLVVPLRHRAVHELSLIHI